MIKTIVIITLLAFTYTLTTPFLSSSPHFGAHSCIFYRGNLPDTSLTIIDQPSPQTFTVITPRVYTSIYKAALCLTSSMIQQSQASIIAYPSTTNRFSISYSTNGLRTYSVNFVLLVVTTTLATGYMDVIYRQKHNCVNINGVNRVSGNIVESLQESTAIGLDTSGNFQILTFIHSISIDQIYPGTIYYGNIALNAAYFNSTTLTITIRADNLDLGVAFIGYTILIFNKVKLLQIGSYYSSAYSISQATIAADAAIKFNIPTNIYGSIFDLNCTIGQTSMNINNYYSNGLINYGGYYFNYQTDPISDVLPQTTRASSLYQQSFTLQIFCFVAQTCSNNLVVVNSTCQCAGTATEVSGYCITVSGCIDAFMNATGAVECRQCGYGLYFNSTSTQCICVTYSVVGGCTNIDHCAQISYSNITTSQCIRCSTTFTLINNTCQCAYGKVFNSTLTQCICIDITIATGCTNIKNCIQISNISPYQSICITCATSFILLNGSCICAYGKVYNSTLQQCQCLDINLASGCTTITHCNEVTYINPYTSVCITCAATFTLINGTCICAYGKVYNSTLTQCICLDTTLASGCTNIKNCIEISNISPYQSICITCTPSFTLLNGTCICAYGKVYNSTLQQCICLDTTLASGCTNIKNCIEISNLNPTQSICITCIPSFILLNGTCTCAYGKIYNATSNSCICLDITLASGCTKLTNCLQVSYSSPNTTRCITCASTFTLVDGQCQCGYNKHFNSSSNNCVCLTTPIPGGCNIYPNCLQISFTAWNVSQCLICSPGTLLTNGYCSTPSYQGTVTTPQGGLDNISLSVLVAIIGMLLLSLAALVFYLCYKSGTSAAKATFPQTSIINNAKQTIQNDDINFTHEELNNQSNTMNTMPYRPRKRRTGNNEKQPEMDVHQFSIDQKDI